MRLSHRNFTIVLLVLLTAYGLGLSFLPLASLTLLVLAAGCAAFCCRLLDMIAISIEHNIAISKSIHDNVTTHSPPLDVRNIAKITRRSDHTIEVQFYSCNAASVFMNDLKAWAPNLKD